MRIRNAFCSANDMRYAIKPHCARTSRVATLVSFALGNVSLGWMLSLLWKSMTYHLA